MMCLWSLNYLILPAPAKNPRSPAPVVHALNTNPRRSHKKVVMIQPEYRIGLNKNYEIKKVLVYFLIGRFIVSDSFVSFKEPDQEFTIQVPRVLARDRIVNQHR